jgi:hypothetical protein
MLNIQQLVVFSSFPLTCLHLVFSHHRISTREKVKLVHHMKQNLTGEKYLRCLDQLVPDVIKYTPELILNIIEL